MPTETIVGIAITVAIAAVLILGVVPKLIPKREPKEKFFRCSRCGTTTRHTERAKEAWRNNKTKFFCQTCHVNWLQSQRPRVLERVASRSAATGSGCLGVIAVFALLPLGCLVMWAYA